MQFEITLVETVTAHTPQTEQMSQIFLFSICSHNAEFVDLCTPQSNYGIKGSLALFLNPVIHLTPEQQLVCRRDFELLEQRIRDTEHRFYRETLINTMQAAILDFFDFHARIYGESDISTQNASIMNRFLKMLEEGTYREHREVTYYADCLCVTSKYLSEVSKKVSGYAANYWINRYTILDITRLLRDSFEKRFIPCNPTV